MPPPPPGRTEPGPPPGPALPGRCRPPGAARTLWEGENLVKHTVSLKENRIFRRLYAKGKSAVAPTMVLYCRKNGRGESRLGLTTGTKLGHAVVRNRVRRRLREIYRLQEHQLLPGYDIVVVARVRAVHSKYADLERDFLRLAKKLQLLSPPETREKKP